MTAEDCAILRARYLQEAGQRVPKELALELATHFDKRGMWDTSEYWINYVKQEYHR